MIRNFRRVRLHNVVRGDVGVDAQHAKVDGGVEAGRQPAGLAPTSRSRSTRAFGAGSVLVTLVESSLEELLVRLAHVDPVVGAGVLPQAADGAGQLAPHQFQLASRLHWFAPVHTRQHGRLDKTK